MSAPGGRKDVMSRSSERNSRPMIEQAIRDMYGSISEDTRFDQIMHRLGAVFRSSISGVHTEDFGTHRRRLTLVGDVTADEYVRLTDDYCHRWNGQNLWMERSLEGFQQQGYHTATPSSPNVNCTSRRITATSSSRSTSATASPSRYGAATH